MTFGILYILYSGLTQTFNWILAITIIILTIEGLVFFLNKWRCPLTDLAMKYGATEEQAMVTNKFYHHWFVPYVFKVNGVLFVIAVIIVLVRYSF
jgi:hypothetical protein